eukprot:UN24282
MFGIIIIMIEFPRQIWNRYVQNLMFRWVRLLTRLWGRAACYFAIAMLCMSNGEDAARLWCGAVVMVLCFLMLYMSFHAASVAKDIVKTLTHEYDLKHIPDENENVDTSIDDTELTKYKIAPGVASIFEETYKRLTREGGSDM